MANVCSRTANIAAQASIRFSRTDGGWAACGYIGRVHCAICNVHRQEKKGGEGSYVRVRWDTSKARARTLQTLRPAHGTDTAGRVIV